MSIEHTNSIAVLVDADNTEVYKIQAVLKEISARGNIIVKRAYGNWRKPVLSSWDSVLKNNAFKAIQQFDYVSGKNATDMALVIDAMDLLSTGRYDTFVIVSSDSDFTPLAIKLRESGIRVIGVGREVTSQSFKSACDEFLLLENLAMPMVSENSNTEESSAKKHIGIGSVDESTKALIYEAWQFYKDEDGWANAAAVGNYLVRVKPDFDPRTYGFRNLSALIRSDERLYRYKMEHNAGGVGIFYFRCVSEQ